MSQAQALKEPFKNPSHFNPSLFREATSIGFSLGNMGVKPGGKQGSIFGDISAQLESRLNLHSNELANNNFFESDSARKNSLSPKKTWGEDAERQLERFKNNDMDKAVDVLVNRDVVQAVKKAESEVKNTIKNVFKQAVDQVLQHTIGLNINPQHMFIENVLDSDLANKATDMVEGLNGGSTFTHTEQTYLSELDNMKNLAMNSDIGGTMISADRMEFPDYNQRVRQALDEVILHGGQTMFRDSYNLYDTLSPVSLTDIGHATSSVDFGGIKMEMQELGNILGGLKGVRASKHQYIGLASDFKINDNVLTVISKASVGRSLN